MKKSIERDRHRRIACQSPGRPNCDPLEGEPGSGISQATMSSGFWGSVLGSGKCDPYAVRSKFGNVLQTFMTLRRKVIYGDRPNPLSP